MSKVTLTRALAEVKALDTKIKRITAEPIKFVDMVQNKNERCVETGISRDEFIKSVQEFEQSLNGLKKRRTALKKAILNANANTVVKITGLPDMVIAEAIERKKFIMDDEALLRAMKQQHLRITQRMEEHNKKIMSEMPKTMEQLLGNSKMKDLDGAKILQMITELNSLEKIDPINLYQKIEKLEKEIEAFKTNIDFSLSEVNAKTEVEVDD